MIGLEITYTADNALPNEQSITDGLRQALVMSAEYVQREAKANVDRDLNTTGQATGALRDSIDVAIDPVELRAEIGSKLIYSRIHELGGVIRAINAPYLKFRTPDGAWHSVKEVTIPARPYLQPALDSSRDFIEQAIGSVSG